MGPWATEINPEERFGCFMKVCKFARRMAVKFQRPILVKHLGHHPAHNQDITKADFLMHPDGSRRPEGVDPTWG